jgi:hypothetical protein
MAEYLISLLQRIQEVDQGRRVTIEGMTFWGSCGGDRLTILEFNKLTKGFQYRRTFARSDEVNTSRDIVVLGNLDDYFDIRTVSRDDLVPSRPRVSTRPSACVDISD